MQYQPAPKVSTASMKAGRESVGTNLSDLTSGPGSAKPGSIDTESQSPRSTSCAAISLSCVSTFGKSSSLDRLVFPAFLRFKAQWYCYDPGLGLSRDVERCTSANVYAVAEGLKVNEPSVSTQMKGQRGNKWSVRPQGYVNNGIGDGP
jgi:hypothetical protein